jgi:hypothetical protein
MMILGFNIFKNIQTHLFAGFKFCSINQLRFEGFEKAFNVIPSIAFTTHTLFGFLRFQQIGGLFTIVLNFSVRMENHSFRTRPVFVGHPDSRDDGFRAVEPVPGVWEGSKMTAFVNGVSKCLFKVGMCLPTGPCVNKDDVRYIVVTISNAII